MSRKKNTTVGVDLVLFNLGKEEAKRRQRSFSWVVERALLEHFRFVARADEGEIAGGEKGAGQNAK